MEDGRTTALATLIVIVTGVLWGVYWLPVRRLAELDLPGAWGTLAIVAAATFLLTPLAIWRRRRLARADRLAMVSVALGGTAFVLYSVGLVYGRVAIIILLFFLTPVWSTLIGHYVMGWPTPRLRLAAIVVGIAGLAIMLGADGGTPLPRGAGEWLALISGVLWSIATTGIRSKAALGPSEAAFVFAGGAFAGALVLAPALAPWPTGIAMQDLGQAVGWAVVAGGLWWGASIASLMWATARLEPARVGILLMTEVIVGAVSAAILAGEHLGSLEIIGGALVLCAGILEVWPIRRRGGAGLV
ncbi:DMT family transporter [Ectothiorhodospiraceae bacterium WFHF3C12]|nr:DMT family transporter [Ectothiorhodospiraceae bacterium WFHF3C12]